MGQMFFADGVNTAAVEAYIKKCAGEVIFIHAIQVVKGNKPLLRLCFSPYDFDDRIHVYSLSKSFTSVAVGVCMDEGLLSPDTLMCELFADKMPDEIPERLRKMKLSDLLSMQSGHGVCALSEMRSAEDSLRTFFAQPLVYDPGTTFIYSTGATCVCAAAVERVTGMKLADFLYEKVLSHIGIERPYWLECKDGQTIGGTGIFVSSNDITRFGMLLKNKGVWQGKRLVSEEYLADAVSVHSVDINNGSPDWTAGYGYQFWRNSRGGFRGDGAYGQLCMVFPKEDTVVSVVGEVGNMSLEVRLIYELLDNLLLPGVSDADSLQKLTDTLYIPEKYLGKDIDAAYEVGESPSRVSKISLRGGKDGLTVSIVSEFGTQKIFCGNGIFTENRVFLRCLSPSINQFDPRFGTEEPVDIFASFEVSESGEVTVWLRHRDTPHSQRWVFDEANGIWRIDLYSGMLACRKMDIKPV